jgi:hypothetical protein
MAQVVEPDPIQQRREAMRRLAIIGQRVGYGLLGVAVVAFAISFALSFPDAAVRTVIVALILSCIVLPPAIILGFAVRAAEREDRERGRGSGGGFGTGR